MLFRKHNGDLVKIEYSTNFFTRFRFKMALMNYTSNVKLIHHEINSNI